LLRKMKQKDMIDNPKFCLLGSSFETSNMGVGALTAGTIESIIHSHPNADIALLDYGSESKIYKLSINEREYPVRLLNIRFSKKFYLKNNIAYLIFLSFLLRIIPIRAIRQKIIQSNPCLNYIDKANVITSIAGGDSFSDIYGLVRLIYIALPQLLIIFLKKKLILLPQTYGPFKSDMAKFIARFILNHSFIIYSRDYRGIDNVKALMNDKEISYKLRFCHDVGFVVAPVKPLNTELPPPAETNQLVGLNVSGLLFMGGYTKNNMFSLKANYAELIYELIDHFIKIKGLRVLLVPHVFGNGKNSESDQAVCEMIFRELSSCYPDKLYIVKGKHNQNEIKYVIGKCDFFIGARMHACIAALSQCIPAVGIAYSNKFKGVFETVGVEGLVADPRILGKEAIIEVIDQIYNQRNEIRAKLQQLIPQAQNNVFDIFNQISFKNFDKYRGNNIV